MLRVLTAAAFVAATAFPALAGTISFEGEYVLADGLRLEPCLECRLEPLSEHAQTVYATVAFTVTDAVLSGALRPFAEGPPEGLLAFEFVLQGGGPSDGTYTLADVTGLIFQTDGPIDLTQDLVGQASLLDFNFFTSGPVGGVATNVVAVGGDVLRPLSDGLIEPYELQLSSLRATSAPVPVPAAGLLLAPALLAFAALRRRRGA